MDSKSKAMDTTSVNFSGSCGEAVGNPNSASSSTGMYLNQSATINGEACNNCMVGNNGAAVFSIELIPIAGPFYNYQISVYAQGPKGFGTGWFWLAFTDATNDTYYLSIYSSTPEYHTVDFNSVDPTIVKIWWCDDSFSVPGPQADKADFRVSSPARK